jgi:hypothetical protein
MPITAAGKGSGAATLGDLRRPSSVRDKGPLDPAYTRSVSSRFLIRSADRVTTRIPGLRWIPVVRLVATAELAMLIREHLMRLEQQERRRLFELVRLGRGRRRNLSAAEREELEALIDKMQPRLLAGAAAERFSPVRLPKTLLYGRRGRGRGRG